MLAAHHRAFPTPQPARHRYLMIDGEARAIRNDSDVVTALADVMVDLTTGAMGSCSEGDLLNIGFTKAELAEHLPNARAAAARQLKNKAI